MKFFPAFVISCCAIALMSCEKGPSYREPSFDGANYVMDINTLQENRPEFYSLFIQDKRVSFFLIKVDGDVKSYFNACRECYSRKLGFRFDDGYVACRSCNVKYSVEALKDGMGSCYPIHLKGSVNGNRYIISKDAMLAGIKYF